MTNGRQLVAYTANELSNHADFCAARLDLPVYGGTLTQTTHRHVASLA